MELREYVQSDLAAVDHIDPFSALQIQYHSGVTNKNIVCLVEGETLVGFGFLILMLTADLSKKQKVDFSMQLDESYRENQEARALVLNGLIQRFHTLKSQYPGVSFYMQTFLEQDEKRAMEFFLNMGFGMRSVIPVLKYDLDQPTLHHDIPPDIEIQRLQFNETTMRQYLAADSAANAEIAVEADIWFNTGNPNFACYAAVCNGEVVGSISVWSIVAERAATENIFVVPAFRRKNIARELIATAFDVLKERGMKIATLSVKGMNLNAIRLYLSCGYKLYYNLIKMTYE